MKKFLNKLLILLFCLTLVPTFVFAEGEKVETEEKKQPIQIYEFYGSSCGYCAALNSWFDSIEEEYGDYFDLVKYEVWASEENTALMNEVAKAFGDSINGVPYLIIGDYTVNGYSEDDNEALLQNIIAEYEKNVDERDTTALDVINNFKFEKDEPNPLVVGIIVVAVVAVLGFIIFKARQE